MALKGQDFLLLPLGDLELPVDHLRLCVLVGNGARRVGVVTVAGERGRKRARQMERESDRERGRWSIPWSSVSVSLSGRNLLRHDHLHEHFQSRIAVPSSQAWRQKHFKM